MEDLDSTKVIAGVAVGAAVLGLTLLSRRNGEKDEQPVAEKVSVKKKKPKKKKKTAGSQPTFVPKTVVAVPTKTETPAEKNGEDKPTLSKSQKKKAAKARAKAAAAAAAAEEEAKAKAKAKSKSKAKKAAKANGKTAQSQQPKPTPVVAEPQYEQPPQSEGGWSVVKKKQPKKKPVATESNSEQESSKPSATLKLAAKDLSAVIGSGGKNIQRIQQESGANVNIPRDNNADAAFRDCIITGNADQVAIATQLVKEYIEFGGPRCEASVSFTVSNRDANLVIGTGGSNIRKFQQEFPESRIDVSKASGVATVTIQGTKEDVPSVERAVKSFIAANNVKRIIPLETDRIVQAVFGASGARKMEIQESSQARLEIQKLERVVTVIGTRDQVEKASAMVLQTIADEKGPPKVKSGEVCERVEIGGATGQIVGAGGKTIQGLQQRTGASIDIKDDNTCYVFGKPDAVKKALKEVQDIVAKYEENVSKTDLTQSAYAGANAKTEWDVPPLDGRWAITTEIPAEAGADGWGNIDLGAAQGW